MSRALMDTACGLVASNWSDATLEETVDCRHCHARSERERGVEGAFPRGIHIGGRKVVHGAELRHSPTSAPSPKKTKRKP